MGTPKYQFDIPFQEYLLASILGDLGFLKKNRHVIQPEYFDEETLSGICGAAVSFYDKHAALPDSASVLEELKGTVALGRKLGEYRDRLRSVLSKVGTNTNYYQTAAIQFARNQAVLSAVREAQILIQEGSLDEILPLIQKAVAVGRGGSNIYDFFSKIKTRAIDYKNKRINQNDALRITTGIDSLNEVTHGGLGPGELGIVVAPPKRGKSTFLVNLGASATLANKTVLHVTLEMRERMVAAKYDARFFGSTFMDIQKKPKRFLKAMRALRDKLQAKLHIVEFPTRTLSVAQLRGIASDIEGLGLVIVDYADLMKPAKRMDERRFELGEIYESLRGLAGEMGVPIWTASQSNKQSLYVKHIDMEHLAESIDKVAIADLILSLCQSQQEADAGDMRLFVMANRLGPSKSEIQAKVNWESALIEEA